MKPTQADLKYVELIKKHLDDPAVSAETQEDLRDEWMSLGQDYFMLNAFGDDPEFDNMFLNRRQGSALIRHGESEGNIGLPTDSPAGIRLTQKGYEQAEYLAKSVVTQPDLIVVSPYIRTQQTAEALVGRCTDVLVETWKVHEFSYLNPVKYAGTTEAERGKFAQSYWERCDPDWRDGDGAESFRDFIGRVDAALARLRDEPERWTLVFTHGYFIKAAELRISAPDSPVDAALMSEFRQARQAGVLGNCKWLVVNPPVFKEEDAQTEN